MGNGLPEKGMILLSAMVNARPKADALIYLSHSVLECGWFVRVIGENNYWGIKAYPGWKGLVVYRPTDEAFEKKEDADAFRAKHPEYPDPPYWSQPKLAWMVKCHSAWRDWSTPDEAVAWYFGLLRRRYPISYNATNPAEFVDGLYEGDGGRKYTTSPILFYKNSIVKIYDRLKRDGVLGC